MTDAGFPKNDDSSTEKGPITPCIHRQGQFKSFTFYGTAVTRWVFYKRYDDSLDVDFLQMVRPEA